FHSHPEARPADQLQEPDPDVGLLVAQPGKPAPGAGSVSKVEMTTPMALICKVLLPSISTFEIPPSCLLPNRRRRARRHSPTTIAVHSVRTAQRLCENAGCRESTLSKPLQTALEPFDSDVTALYPHAHGCLLFWRCWVRVRGEIHLCAHGSQPYL